MGIVKRRILERRASERVQREIAAANEMLAATGRVDPQKPGYKRYKAIMRYSYDNNMTFHEAQAAWAKVERSCGTRIYDYDTLLKTK